ncbi:uncharacterized protein PAC_15673 [Phialocephala subalpina]|uniref:Uncharacterized protein n=1 Tax=Phialocephala subalpina TaxID=576137 RepID=A0A1L7XL77_9HELO|nr:uncharacterized protein PAC_15673 [Phialocephala subalpina]
MPFHSPTSFMSLPIELRQGIYKYLIPDDHVPAYWVAPRIPPWPGQYGSHIRILRHDKQPCCTEILRINRQIHDEVIGLFYGTASFGVHINGPYCFFLGVKYCTEDLDLAMPNTLPPTFRLVRSLSISIFLSWSWESSTGSTLPPLPFPTPGTNLISDCLKKGSYNLSQVLFDELRPELPHMPLVAHVTIRDRGWLYKVAQLKYLGPLHILRGVDLKFDGIGPMHVDYARIIARNPELSSQKEVRHVLEKILILRKRALRQLAEQVMQDT